MNKIITLTVNPAVDKNSTVPTLLPDNKLRCSAPNFEAGGGGINVSRAIKELGEDALCLFFGGGFTGDHLGYPTRGFRTKESIPKDGRARTSPLWMNPPKSNTDL